MSRKVSLASLLSTTSSSAPLWLRHPLWPSNARLGSASSTGAEASSTSSPHRPLSPAWSIQEHYPLGEVSPSCLPSIPFLPIVRLDWMRRRDADAHTLIFRWRTY
ncbi:hypothetical protein B0H16DRAFT_1884205 [Mycena metata]|uniref:Uncharacterized protein n=1 Tax=Mycena metata TaxID=1033252 RepID=A0AAD7NHA2_9AGAR|nr:hypothetical protein B0H16DRAFT_1884205 [Mycena metata]